MYYVIIKQADTPQVSVIGFSVPKFYASKNGDNVIFEFSQDGKKRRKWVKKEEVLLVTDSKEFFLKTMKRFKKIETYQQKLIDEAKEKLNQSICEFNDSMTQEMDEFTKIRSSKDVPCLLKEV
jgi:predicted transcriptional regulator